MIDFGNLSIQLFHFVSSHSSLRMSNLVPHVVIDANDHLLGRLSSVVAKELLSGKKVVVVHAEKIAIAGTFFRTRQHYIDYFQKRTNFNHTRGPFHFHDPAVILRKTVRRMCPNKTQRGKAAMQRLSTFSGVPDKYATNHVIVPEAMRELRLKPTSKYCVLGDIAEAIGWKYAAPTADQEKHWAVADQKRRAEWNADFAKAMHNPEVAKLTEQLKKYGYGQ